MTALLLTLLMATSNEGGSARGATTYSAAPALEPGRQTSTVANGAYGYAPLRQIGDESVDVVERLGEPIPAELRFYDGFHNEVALKDFLGRGKPVVLTLVYFDCPMLCSLVMKGLVKGLNETGLQLGKGYQGITLSFDPKDTPRAAAEAQRGYLAGVKGLERAHAQDWPFLTGGEANVRALADSLGFKYRYDGPTAQFAHPAVAFVLTPEGRISRYLYGVEFPGRDLRLSLVEASDGRVGTSFDRVLLKCFRYDPGTGRYRVYATNFVRGGALLSGLGLAFGLALLWRQEWKRKRGAA